MIKQNQKNIMKITKGSKANRNFSKEEKTKNKREYGRKRYTLKEETFAVRKFRGSARLQNFHISRE